MSKREYLILGITLILIAGTFALLQIQMKRMKKCICNDPNEEQCNCKKDLKVQASEN